MGSYQTLREEIIPFLHLFQKTLWGKTKCIKRPPPVQTRLRPLIWSEPVLHELMVRVGQGLLDPLWGGGGWEQVAGMTECTMCQAFWWAHHVLFIYRLTQSRYSAHCSDGETVVLLSNLPGSSMTHSLLVTLVSVSPPPSLPFRHFLLLPLSQPWPSRLPVFQATCLAAGQAGLRHIQAVLWRGHHVQAHRWEWGRGCWGDSGKPAAFQVGELRPREGTGLSQGYTAGTSSSPSPTPPSVAWKGSKLIIYP